VNVQIAFRTAVGGVSVAYLYEQVENVRMFLLVSDVVIVQN